MTVEENAKKGVNLDINLLLSVSKVILIYFGGKFTEKVICLLPSMMVN